MIITVGIAVSTLIEVLEASLLGAGFPVPEALILSAASLIPKVPVAPLLIEFTVMVNTVAVPVVGVTALIAGVPTEPATTLKSPVAIVVASIVASMVNTQSILVVPLMTVLPLLQIKLVTPEAEVSFDTEAVAWVALLPAASV